MDLFRAVSCDANSNAAGDYIESTFTFQRTLAPFVTSLMISLARFWTCQDFVSLVGVRGMFTDASSPENSFTFHKFVFTQDAHTKWIEFNTFIFSCDVLGHSARSVELNTSPWSEFRWIHKWNWLSLMKTRQKRRSLEWWWHFLHAAWESRCDTSRYTQRAGSRKISGIISNSWPYFACFFFVSRHHFTLMTVTQLPASLMINENYANVM